MISIFSDNADSLYRKVLKKIMEDGQVTYPRGFCCLELTPCNISLLYADCNIISNPLRKINKGFAAAEMMWILEGRDDVAYLDPYNSKIKAYSDDGVKFFGAYGPKFKGQMDYVISTLMEDPWSRQAVINIWRENPPKTKDVPCTIMFQFIRRPVDRLNLVVYMRSQDCWLGLPYDLHNFTCFQIIVANLLGIKPGKFDLIQGSLHAYESDWDKINKLCSGPLPATVTTTPTDTNMLLLQKKLWMKEYLDSKLRM